MKILRILAYLVLSINMFGCVSYQAVGRFSDYNEVFHGTVNANLMVGGGSFSLKGSVTDISCTGTSSPPTVIPSLLSCSGQMGNLYADCTDGRHVIGQWVATSCSTGYGKARDDVGNEMYFTFGLSEEEAKVKIDQELKIAESNPELPAYNPKQHRKEKGFSTGTGFFVSHDGYIVSNFHVIEDASEIEIVTTDGRKLVATVVSKDRANDVALLKVEGTFKPIPIISSSKIKRAGEVMTLGYPLVQIQGQEQKATFGRINSLTGIDDDVRFFQIDTPIQPGNSGGPLISIDGKVIGVVTATLNQLKILSESGRLSQNVNYAVKTDYVLPLLVAINLDLAADGPTISGFEKIAETYEESVCFIISK